MKNRILAILGSLIFTVLLIISPSYAEKNEEGIFINNYVMDGENMLLNYTVMPLKNNIPTEPGSTHVKIGSKEYKIKEIKKMVDLGYPQTYIFLVDVSGSLDYYQMAYIKSVISKIAEKMNSKDSMLIYTFDEKPTCFLELTKDRNIINTRIEDIKSSGGITNLYGSVQKVIEDISKNNDINVRKNLIILSDGIDFTDKGKVVQEVYDTIKDSGIPIYAVSFDKYVSGTNLAKEYVSLANKSEGGFGIYVNDGEDAADEIVYAGNNSYIAKVDLSKFDANMQNPEITIKLDEKDLTNKKKLTQEQLDKIVKSVKTASSVNKNESEQGQVQTNETENKTQSMPIMLIIVIVLAIIVIGIIVFILMKNKKSIEMTLLDASDDRNTRKFKLKKPVTIGRGASNDIKYPNDNMLSSNHCVIEEKDGLIFVKDLGSTNGTYVNGIKVNGESKLKNGDILLIGSMELKINIQVQ